MADKDRNVTAMMIKTLWSVIGSGFIVFGVFFIWTMFDQNIGGKPICGVIGNIFFIIGIIFIYLAIWYDRKIKELQK